MFQFKTRLTLPQTQRQLERFYHSRARFHYKDKAHDINGNIKDNDFRFMVRDTAQYRRAFRPILVGKIEPTLTGTVVKCKFKLDKGEKIIMAIWLVPLILLSIYFGVRTYLSFSRGSGMGSYEFLVSIAPAIMVFLTFLWVGVTRLIFREYKILRGFITEAFQGVLEQ